MVDDVLLAKAESIERCLRRVREEYEGHETDLATDYTRQDALLLNLLRACETSIDIAMHLVREQRLGIPQNSRHAFEMLADAGLLPAELAESMKRMVGFRNVAIHHYRELDLTIVRRIVTERLGDFRALARLAIEHAGQ